MTSLIIIIYKKKLGTGVLVDWFPTVYVKVWSPKAMDGFRYREVRLLRYGYLQEQGKCVVR